MYECVAKPDSRYRFAFRMNQYRYNMSTKESQAVGFLELIPKDPKDLPAVQTATWRALTASYVTIDKDKKEVVAEIGNIWFKQTRKGVLMDIASIMQDFCLLDGMIRYPDTLTISHLPWLENFEVKNVEKLMNETAGLVFFKGVSLPSN